MALNEGLADKSNLVKIVGPKCSEVKKKGLQIEILIWR